MLQGKQIKAVELKDKSIVALYQVGDDVFCSDANSTAYKFPLTNATIIEREIPLHWARSLTASRSRPPPASKVFLARPIAPIRA